MIAPPVLDLTITVGDVGTPIVVTFLDPSGAPLDIAGSTGVVMVLSYPDGVTTQQVVAAVVGDGTAGQVQYLTQAGVVSQDGQWVAQAQLVLPNGDQRSTQEYVFWVQPAVGEGSEPVPPPTENVRAYNEPLAGTHDGVNAVFTASRNFISGTQEVFVGGIFQTPPAAYTVTGANQITFAVPPPVDSGDLTISYDYLT